MREVKFPERAVQLLSLSHLGESTINPVGYVLELYLGVLRT